MFTITTNVNGDQEQRNLLKDIVVHGPRNVLVRRIVELPSRNVNGLDSELPPHNITDALGFQLERMQEERNAVISLEPVTQANARSTRRNVDSWDQPLLVLSKIDANGFIKNTTFSVQKEDNVAESKNIVNMKLASHQNALLKNRFADGHPELEFAMTVSGKSLTDVTREFQL